MRLSTGGVSANGTTFWEDTGTEFHRTARTRMTLAMAVALLVGCIGIVFGTSAKPASRRRHQRPDPVRLGAGLRLHRQLERGPAPTAMATPPAVPPTSPSLMATLNDGLGETFTAGSAFDAAGNLYVADDYLGDIVEYSPTGAYMGCSPAGSQNPLSVAFDAAGNLYVGQQGTNTIASSSDRGPGAQHRAGADREHRDRLDHLGQPVHHRLHVGRPRDLELEHVQQRTRAQCQRDGVLAERPRVGPAHRRGVPVPGSTERAGARRRLCQRVPLEPRRQRRPDLPLHLLRAVWRRLRGLALRHQPRPRRPLLLDCGLPSGLHLAGRHRDRPSAPDDRHRVRCALRPLGRQPD